MLLETTDSDKADAAVAVLREAGFAVAVCAGPLPHDRCPLAGGDGCAAAEGADAVVSSLGFLTAEARDALAALRLRLPRTPVLVEANADDAARWATLVDGCRVVGAPAAAGQLLEGVRAVLAQEVGDVA